MKVQVKVVMIDESYDGNMTLSTKFMTFVTKVLYESRELSRKTQVIHSVMTTM
jgi:hypothetical protein